MEQKLQLSMGIRKIPGGCALKGKTSLIEDVLCELGLQEANPTDVRQSKSENMQAGDDKPLGAVEHRTYRRCRHSTWCWSPESGTVGTNTERPEKAEEDGAVPCMHEGGGVARQAEREGRQARGASEGRRELGR